MSHARVFKSGNSQAVRLPKEFRFAVEQVEIFRRGDEVVLREIPANATSIFDALGNLPQDLTVEIEKRNDTPPQPRESF